MFLRFCVYAGGAATCIFHLHFFFLFHRSGLQTLRNLRVTHLHIWSQQQLCYHLTWKWVVFGIVCIGDCEDVFCYYCPYQFRLSWPLHLFCSLLLVLFLQFYSSLWQFGCLSSRYFYQCLTDVYQNVKKHTSPPVSLVGQVSVPIYVVR